MSAWNLMGDQAQVITGDSQRHPDQRDDLTGELQRATIRLFQRLPLPLQTELDAEQVGGAFATQSMAAIIVAIVIVVVGLTLLGLVQASLQGSYAAALYRYAEDGEVGHGFDQALLEQAFKPK